jgi:hypothetical protein
MNITVIIPVDESANHSTLGLPHASGDGTIDLLNLATQASTSRFVTAVPDFDGMTWVNIKVPGDS